MDLNTESVHSFGVNQSCALAAAEALHKRSPWLLEDYADLTSSLTWHDLRMLLSKPYTLKVLEIDAFPHEDPGEEEEEEEAIEGDRLRAKPAEESEGSIYLDHRGSL